MTEKNSFKKLFVSEGSLVERILIITFTFWLFQISITSILIFLEPKLYANFRGFSIKENIYLYLAIMTFIFLINLILWYKQKVSKVKV